jgi:adenosylmethionine-8-amino-7-oxononanoate aminotransferase
MRPRGAMMRPLGDVIVLMPAVAMDMKTLTKLLAILEDTLKNDVLMIVKG